MESRHIKRGEQLLQESMQDEIEARASISSLPEETADLSLPIFHKWKNNNVEAAIMGFQMVLAEFDSCI